MDTPFDSFTQAIRVLVVEDNIDHHKLLSIWFRMIGLSIETASDGQEALFKLNASPFDIVFLDCQLPRMDGYAMVQELRRQEGNQRHIPVVALTAYALAGDREKCLEYGMDDYISKPCSLPDIVAMIRKWVILNPHSARLVSQD
jgi:CheY-like chemotaxis protein